MRYKAIKGTFQYYEINYTFVVACGCEMSNQSLFQEFLFISLI